MRCFFCRLIYNLIIVIFVSVFISSSAYSYSGITTVLKLERKVDDKLTTLVEFFSTIDPNSVGGDNNSSVKVDGVLVNVPSKILDDLHYSRRYFSYDPLSDGIRYSDGRWGLVCKLGGPSKGLIMSALYLTYTKQYRIANKEVRPVYSEPRNCLFMESYSPISDFSREEAIRIMAVLETLYKIYSKK